MASASYSKVTKSRAEEIQSLRDFLEKFVKDHDGSAEEIGQLHTTISRVIATLESVPQCQCACIITKDDFYQSLAEKCESLKNSVTWQESELKQIKMTPLGSFGYERFNGTVNSSTMIRKAVEDLSVFIDLKEEPKYDNMAADLFTGDWDWTEDEAVNLLMGATANEKNDKEEEEIKIGEKVSVESELNKSSASGDQSDASKAEPVVEKLETKKEEHLQLVTMSDNPEIEKKKDKEVSEAPKTEQNAFGIVEEHTEDEVRKASKTGEDYSASSQATVQAQVSHVPNTEEKKSPSTEQEETKIQSPRKIEKKEVEKSPKKKKIKLVTDYGNESGSETESQNQSTENRSRSPSPVSPSAALPISDSD